MPKIKLTKYEIINLIETDKLEVWRDNRWEYPKTGDDQKSCPMLDAMFHIEKRAGYIIFIPEDK